MQQSLSLAAAWQHGPRSGRLLGGHGSGGGGEGGRAGGASADGGGGRAHCAGPGAAAKGAGAKRAPEREAGGAGVRCRGRRA